MTRGRISSRAAGPGTWSSPRTGSAEEALATKYGIAFRLVSLLNRLGRRRVGAPVYYEFHLSSADVWRWEEEAGPVCDWTTGTRTCGQTEERRFRNPEEVKGACPSACCRTRPRPSGGAGL